MRQMEQKILDEATILDGGVLKVGSFLNQQIDPVLLGQMAEEIKRLFGASEVNKILTIESSGIAIAAAAGMAMNVPVVFAKKHRSSNVDGDVYSTSVHSFTHGEDYRVVVSRDYLTSEDRVLIVDDFLAKGNALLGLIDLADQAGAGVEGVAVAIEKRFQGGGDRVRSLGYRVEPLACIESMDEKGVNFCSL